MRRSMVSSTSSATPAARLAAVQRHLSSSSSTSSPTSPPSSASASPKPARGTPPSASEFKYWLPFQTRWHDNDSYGHMNNVTYSQYFDSLTNHFLLTHVPSPRPLGLIVSSQTTYASSLSYPSPVLGALSIQSLSGRSVVWRIALFEGEYAPGEGVEGFRLEDVATEGGRRIRLKGGEEATAEAYGTMTHVFVDPETRKTVKELPEGMRRALEALVVEKEKREK